MSLGGKDSRWDADGMDQVNQTIEDSIEYGNNEQWNWRGDGDSTLELDWGCGLGLELELGYRYGEELAGLLMAYWWRASTNENVVVRTDCRRILHPSRNWFGRKWKWRLINSFGLWVVALAFTFKPDFLCVDCVFESCDEWCVLRLLSALGWFGSVCCVFSHVFLFVQSLVRKRNWN